MQSSIRISLQLQMRILSELLRGTIWKRASELRCLRNPQVPEHSNFVRQHFHSVSNRSCIRSPPEDPDTAVAPPLPEGCVESPSWSPTEFHGRLVAEAEEALGPNPQALGVALLNIKPERFNPPLF